MPRLVGTFQRFGFAGILLAAACNAKPIDPNVASGSSTILAVDKEGLTWYDKASGGMVHAPFDGPPRAIAFHADFQSRNVAVDTTYAYWFDASGALLQARLTGGGASTIAQGTGDWSGIASDGSHVYFSREEAPGRSQDAATTVDLVEHDITSGEERVLANVWAWAIALDSDYIYGAQCQGPVVFRIPRAGGQLEPLTDEQTCTTTLALAGDSLLYLGGQRDREVHRVPRTGGRASVVGPADSDQLATDGLDVYAFHGGSLVRYPLAGGKPETVAPVHFAFDSGVAVDGDRVYWTERDATGYLVARGTSK